MRLRGCVPLAVAGATSLFAASAQAHLGGARSSVDADRAHMGAVMSSTHAATHIRHALSLGEAGEVREYANAQGQVFAVSWETAGRPDLRQLLGESLFAGYQARIGAPGLRRGRGGMGMATDDLVVQNSGRPGAFSGFAYVPSLTPAGFSGADLR